MAFVPPQGGGGGTATSIADGIVTNAKVNATAAIAKSKISTSSTWAAADIPNLDASKITTGQMALARGGTGADLSSLSGKAGQVVTVNSGETGLEYAAISSTDPVFGDGSDGDVTISSNTDLGSSNVKNYSSLTINSGIVLSLDTDGIIKVSGTLAFGSGTSQIDCNVANIATTGSSANGGSGGGTLKVFANTITGTGIISADGGVGDDASGTTGDSSPDGTDGDWQGVAQTSSAGTRGISGTNWGSGGGGGALAGNGGNGGTGSSGAGVGGTAFALVTWLLSWQSYDSTFAGTGGGGSASGPFVTGRNGGAGGGGGGIVIVICYSISAITIRANGGNGGNGSGGGSGGNGGGGGGGLAILYYKGTQLATLSAAGGTVGTGGAGGANGSTGLTYAVVV